MANAYTQLHIHLVFATKHRNALIHQSFEDELHKYISGIIQAKGNKLLAINGMPDHIHIFIGLSPNLSISDLVREIKKASTNWINQSGVCKSKFEWQGGYGAFSYSASHKYNVIRYILNQKEHHRKQSFKTEYLKLLEEGYQDSTSTR
jgi:REP element-mobilizing transposase RayT